MESITLPDNCDGPGVYALEHTPTGRHYVGSSKRMRERALGHVSALRANRHHSWKLQRCWSEGEFVVKVLELVPDHDMLTEREQWWMDELKAWAWVRRMCALPNSTKVGQNFMYDLNFLWTKYGITIGGELEDTMLMHHAMQPEMQKGLGFLGSIYTDEAAWKFMRHNETVKRED